MPSEVPERYWFPAKRYGWGWGAPQSWQGWVVVLTYCGAVVLVSVVMRGAVWKVSAVVVATVILLGVCLKKGEPARWRWGRDDDGAGGGRPAG